MDSNSSDGGQAGGSDTPGQDHPSRLVRVVSVAATLLTDLAAIAGVTWLTMIQLRHGGGQAVFLISIAILSALAGVKTQTLRALLPFPGE